MVKKTEEVIKPKRAPRKTTKRQPKVTESNSIQTEDNTVLVAKEISPLDELVEKTLEANQDLISAEQNISSIDQEVGNSLPIAEVDAEIEKKLVKPPLGSLGS
jgi:outer membrane protein TolC